MSEKNACVAVYPNHQAAEAAVGILHKAGVDLQQVSMVGQGYHGEEHPIGFYQADGGIRYWGMQGAFWGGLWGLLAGAAFFWVPGFGPLAAAGPVAGLLVRGLEGVAVGGGFGVLAAALFDIGVPRHSITEYEQAVKDEQFLLIVHDGGDSVEQACKLLHNPSQQVTVHRAANENSVIE